MRKIFTIVTALIVATGFLSACQQGKNKKSGGNGGGGVDGGGGDFIYLSEADTIDKIEKAWKQIPKDLVTVCEYLHTKANKSPEEAKAFVTLDKMAPCQDLWVLSTPADYLKNVKLDLDKTGYCKGPHGRQHLASVAELNRKSSICISVYGLMRKASAGMEYDLLALFAHEIAHLNGFDEADSLDLQKYFISIMPRLIGKREKEALFWAVYRFTSNVSTMWPILLTYEEVTDQYIENVRRLGVLYYNLKGGVWTTSNYMRNVTDQIQEFDRFYYEYFNLAAYLENRKKEGPVKMSPFVLEMIRKIALGGLRIEQKFSQAFADEREFVAKYGVRTEAAILEDMELAERLTNPELLLDKSRRLEMICEAPVSKNWAERELIKAIGLPPRCKENFPGGTHQNPFKP